MSILHMLFLCKLHTFKLALTWSIIIKEKIAMERFIPTKQFQQEPNSHPWFTLKCAAAISYCNHDYNIYHNEWCSLTLHSEPPTITVRNFWKIQSVAMHTYAFENKLDPGNSGISPSKLPTEAVRLC